MQLFSMLFRRNETSMQKKQKGIFSEIERYLAEKDNQAINVRMSRLICLWAHKHMYPTLHRYACHCLVAYASSIYSEYIEPYGVYPEYNIANASHINAFKTPILIAKCCRRYFLKKC